MVMRTSTLLPIAPKMARQYAERAKRMDGCVKVGSSAYEFALGNTVICLMDIEHPMGFSGKDSNRADEIRALLSARKKGGAS